MSKSETNKSKAKELTGTVIGNKMTATVKVEIEDPMRHPVYKKTLTRHKVFLAHTDEQLELGQHVTIRESRPYSKNVKWVVINKE